MGWAETREGKNGAERTASPVEDVAQPRTPCEAVSHVRMRRHPQCVCRGALGVCMLCNWRGVPSVWMFFDWKGVLSVCMLCDRRGVPSGWMCFATAWSTRVRACAPAVNAVLERAAVLRARAERVQAAEATRSLGETVPAPRGRTRGAPRALDP
eukprot:714-Chlamydomonas_euryale.AAC.1